MRTLAGEIPEELIVTHILPKITDGACVGRCRCVCKSWRDLLSGPSLIRYHKMRSPDSSSSSSDYQILITGVDYKGGKTYSLHSAETLEPLLPTPNSIMLLPSTELHRDLALMKFVGWCNGLFCLSGFDLDASMQLILWNPATSETKVLPPPSNPHVFLLPAVGVGFDSRTNDYKVFRQRNRREDCYYLPPYLMEVYSLRKDSWRVLEGSYPRLSDSPVPTYHKGKLYWRYVTKKGRLLQFDSFDFSSEALETFDLSCPVGLHGCWFNEESLVAAQIPFYDATYTTSSWEIWMLLKCWVSESWVKLFVVTLPLPLRSMECIGLATNMTCFFTNKRRGGSEFAVFDLETQEYNEIKMEGRTSVQAITYMPSRVSFRD